MGNAVSENGSGAPDRAEEEKWRAAAPLFLVLTGTLVYLNSFSGPFVFDDTLATLGNPTLRHWSTALFPPHHLGTTVEGRPILNASLAFNWAVSGPAVWSYHLANLLIHLGAALTLFGVIRRTLGAMAGFVVALLWTVHPLQTESVTYIVQRAESLMALFYLLTLYCFIRQAEAESAPGAKTPRRWAGLSIFCCLLGMATKEVMVSAPLLVFLYDRALLSGSFRAAWRRHGRIHLALASTWLLLALLVIGTGNRGGTSGFGSGVSVFKYWSTQPIAIARYLKLSVWPRPLVFDYGTQWVTQPASVIAPALLLLALFCIAAWGLIKNRPWALLGVVFFAVLAPTSVVSGNRQTSAEHRMYLPLAAVLIVTVAGAAQAAGRVQRTRPVLLGLSLLALPLGGLTAARNRDYRSWLALCRDNVEKLPDNAFARYNLGKALQEAGDPRGALEQYQAAIHYEPGTAQAYDNMGNTLRELGRPVEAEAAYRSALRLSPNAEKARYNLGNLLLQLNRKSEAAEQFNEAVRLDPADVDARDNLGGVLLELGRPREAEQQFLAVLRLTSGTVETHFNLGTAYLLEGRSKEARTEFETCLRIQPGFAPARERMQAMPP